MQNKVEKMVHQRRDDGLFLGWWRDVFNNEELFAGTDEPELAPRDLFDGGWVFPQPASFLAKGVVLSTQAREVGRELVVLFPSPSRGNEALLADEGVDSEHADDEEEQARDDAAPPPLRPTRCQNLSASFGGHEKVLET
jgi:hypothetical protein